MLRKTASFLLLAGVLGLLNVGCSASASIKPTGSTARPDGAAQVAYTTAPRPAR